MADQVSQKRPDGTAQLGTWSVVGAGGIAHTALSDNLDTTFVQNSNRCMTQSQKLRVTIADWTTTDIPVGSKIKALRATARCGTISGITRQPRCVLWFAQSILEELDDFPIIRIVLSIFSWLCPRPPPAAPTTSWVVKELEYATRDAKQREWTLSTINDFTVELGRDDSGTNLKLSEVYVDAIYNQRPVGTATGPTGTTVDTTRPQVSWTYSDVESDPQAAFRVLVFNDDQYNAVGFDPLVTKPYADSGWTLGSDLTWTVNRDLVNDTYRAYVIVRQVWDGIGDHDSAPTFIGWTQNVPGPPAPVITATPEDDLNRVRLDVAKGGTTPGTETYTIQYSDNSGIDYFPVRGGVKITADGSGNAQIWDYEAPLNRARWYRVQAYRTLGTIPVGSDFSNITMAVPRSKAFWLKDVLAPALNMEFPVGYKGDISSRQRASTFVKPLTKDGTKPARAIYIGGPQYGREGRLALTFAEDDQSNWDAFNALYAGGRILLYQHPTGEQFYIGLGDQIEVTDWDIDFGATDDIAPEVAYRLAAVSYEEVDAPAA